MIHRFVLRNWTQSWSASGGELVAVGVQFPSGRCVIKTRADVLGIFESLDELLSSQWVGQDTVLEWLAGHPGSEPMILSLSDH